MIRRERSAVSNGRGKRDELKCCYTVAKWLTMSLFHSKCCAADLETMKPVIWSVVMMRIAKYQLIITCLCFLSAQLYAQTETQQLLDQLLPPIMGKWVPKGEGDKFWKISQKFITLVIPANSKREFNISCDEQLPDSDWTLQFWCYQPDDWTPPADEFKGHIPSIEVNFRLGLDSPVDFSANIFQFSKVNFQVRSSDLRESKDIPTKLSSVLWIKIAFSKRKGKIEVSLNGCPIISRSVLKPLPRSPLEIIIVPHVPRNGEYRVIICGLNWKDVAEFSEEKSWGRAFKGWQKTDDTFLKQIPDIKQRLLQLYDKPELTENGKAEVLAAILLVDKILSGKISQETWSKLEYFLNLHLRKGIYGISTLLPILIASASDEQLKIVQNWIEEYFKACEKKPAGGIPVLREIGERMALVDPIRTTDRLGLAVPSELLTASPERVLAVYYLFLARFDRWLRAAAWFLPDFYAASPIHGALFADYLLEQAKNQKIPRNERDILLAFAAYRSASFAPLCAMKFAELIQGPQLKAEALKYLTEALPEAKDVLKLPEEMTNIRRIIENWKPRREDDTPIFLLTGVARYFANAGKHNDAMMVLKEMGQYAEKLPKVSFEDAFSIAKLMQDLRHPDVQKWWQKAIDAAIARDKEPTGGEIYMAATTILVRELVKNNMFDEAIKAAKIAYQVMPPDNQPDMNYSICMEVIVLKLATIDWKRALKLAMEEPPGDLRDRLLAQCAKNIASQELKTALSLINEVSPQGRANLILSIAEGMPPIGLKDAVELIAEAVKELMKQSTGMSGFLAMTRLERQLSKLPPQILLDLEPYFETSKGRMSKDRLARLILQAIGRTSVQDDPLWQAFSHTFRDYSGGYIPWNEGSIEAAIRWQKEFYSLSFQPLKLLRE